MAKGWHGDSAGHARAAKKRGMGAKMFMGKKLKKLSKSKQKTYDSFIKNARSGTLRASKSSKGNWYSITKKEIKRRKHWSK